jgi:hypothetical protein
VKILLTILACIVVGIAGAIAFVYSGIYDVSALTPDNAIVGWAVHKTSDRSVDARLGGIVAPAGLDDPQILSSGGHLFARNCVVCHGGPGLKLTDIAQGLNPQPPDLFGAKRKPWMEEMFRFIKYGVKKTAMHSPTPRRTTRSGSSRLSSTRRPACRRRSSRRNPAWLPPSLPRRNPSAGRRKKGFRSPTTIAKTSRIAAPSNRLPG